MQVRQRTYPSGRTGWQIDVSGVTVDGKPFRRQLQAPPSVKSESNAKRWGEEQRRRLERGETPATTRAAKRARREQEEAQRETAKIDALQATTVTEAVAWYVEDGQLERLAATTLDIRERVCRDHVCSCVDAQNVLIGDRQVRSLSDADVRSVARQAAAFSDGYAHLIMRMFRGLVESAKGRGVKCEVVVKLPRLPVEEEPRAHDPGTHERLVHAAAERSPTHLALVLLAGEAAMRRGEILGLTVADAVRAIEVGALRIERQVVRVKKAQIVRPPKHGKTRIVPLSSRCVTALRELSNDRDPKERLFLSADGVTPATESTLRWYFDVVQRDVGVPVVGLHALRHSGLTHMVASGVDLKSAQEIAGHGQLSTTARYLHKLNDQVAQAATKVEQWRQEVAVTSTLLTPKTRGRVRRKSKGVA